MTGLLDLWLAQVNESHSGNIAQSFLPGPLRSIILYQLQSASGCSSEDSDELVVVDLGRWSSLSSALENGGKHTCSMSP